MKPCLTPRWIHLHAIRRSMHKESSCLSWDGSDRAPITPLIESNEGGSQEHVGTNSQISGSAVVLCTDRGNAVASGLGSAWAWGWRAPGSRRWTGCPRWSGGTGGWTGRSGGMGCWSGEEGEGGKLRLFMTSHVSHTRYGRREHIVGCAHNRATKTGSRRPSQSSRTFNQQQ